MKRMINGNALNFSAVRAANLFLIMVLIIVNAKKSICLQRRLDVIIMRNVLPVVEKEMINVNVRKHQVR